MKDKNILKKVVLVVTGLFMTVLPAYGVEMDTYCYVPLSVGQVVAPNVLFVMDYSGSMGWCAYNPQSNKANCCNNSNGCGWTYKGTEEGYFIPDKVYAYDTTYGYWVESSGTPETCPKTEGGINNSKKYKGACLNFLYMRRVDLLRWAITGGKPDSCTGNDPKKCDPELYGQPSANLSCNNSGCILVTYSGVKVKVPWARINDALTFQFKNLSVPPRLGGMLYSGTSVRGSKVYIGDFTSSANFDGINPYKNLIAVINYETPSDATPTSPALWDAYNYFAQEDPRYGGFTPQAGNGDKWRNPMYQCFDENNNGVCEGSELKLVYCAKNFVILLTDGQWNMGGNPVISTCSINTSYPNDSADPVVPAYKMHKTGFTNKKTNIYSYVEAVYGIGLWLGGTGEVSLKNVAMYGSFDRSKTWPDSLSGYPQGTCQMDDCCSTSNCGKGSACTSLPASSPDWDKDGNNVPDTFYSASDATEIKEAIRGAILDILRRVSSGTTVVALPPSSTTESSLMARTYFYPEKTVGDKTIKWVGELSSLWFDSENLIRENSDTSGETESLKIMDVKKDYPLSFVFSAPDNAYVAYIYNDLNNNGKPKSCSHNDKQLGDVIPVFSSGSLLAQKDPNTREIKTWVDSNNNGVVDSGEIFSFNPGDSALRNTLKNYWSYGDSLGTCDENCAESVMKYIRGYDRPSPSGSSFRLRQENNSGSNISTAWKLGDTIYSTPRIITNKAINGYDIRYNDTTYRQFINETMKDQKAIIVMGANDGMIHAFRLGKVEDILPPTQNNEGKQVTKITDSATIGEEVWAFIPQNVIPYLRWYCHENYCHIPMLETTFTVLDASIGGNPNDDKTKNSWRRLLIAQMGLGGTKITVGNKTFSSSIMVFDITDHLNPQLLWEKQLPDNTLTFATPGIVRLGDRDKNGSWYLVIGSGPTSITTTSITYPSSPKLYVFNLKTGDKLAEFSISGVSNKAIGDFLSVDMDLPWGDYQVDDLYFGTYNNNSGELYRLRIRKGNTYETSPSNWCPELIIDAGRPVFAAPAITHDHNGVRWLFFGTGIYLTSDHKVITNEKLFGIIERDNCWKNDSSSCNTSCTAINENSDLYNMTNTQFINAKAAEFNCNCPGGITISSGYCYADPQNPNQIICPACSDGTQIITKTRDAKLSGSPISSCNNLEEESAISCVEKSIYEYDPNTNNYSFHKLGWKRTLFQEKLYSSPVVTGGAVLATPFKPSNDICSAGGDTKFIGVYYTTGTPYYQPIIRTEGGTTGTLTALIIEPEVEIGKGPPPTKESIVVKQNPQTGAISAYTQASGGVIKVEVGQPNPPKEMFIHWIAK